ncbi:MAG: hypothetical protein QOF49_1830, partial [Chloroflexota bacterium]|nr:hypothetical protein [Chloroflexota bacterium]
MRTLVAVLSLALITVAGIAAPVAATQTSTAKVVIIVGATHGTTPLYRSYADAAYAEAIKYTAKVTKVYSPNATWSKVKAATQGANIVIYFGHGNGWPSPYTFDPLYATKDGMGLNADLNADGVLTDYENKYYGEPSMAQLGLAPNAIVLLHNLCYASGNNESGVTPEPSISVARQRIDNYAAGFLKGGAKAVLADGHLGPASYLRALFTTSRSILDIWRSSTNYHGHESSFASTRSPGFTDYSDPDGTASGFYRSLVTAPGLTSTAVTKAVGDTGSDPAALVVPGRASVVAAATTSTTPSTTATLLSLPEGTRLKTVAINTPATTTSPAIIEVAGLDDPSIAGLVSAATLAPRDSKAPVVVATDAGSGRISPNGDGRADSLAISGGFSETVSWTATIKNASGAVLDSAAGSGSSTFSLVWDGLVAGVAVPDGTYAWSVRGVDAWQNGAAAASGSIVVDATAPAISSISPDATTVGTFSPNADGVADTIGTAVTVGEPGTLYVRVADAIGTTVRTWTTTTVAGVNTVVWDGKSNSGALAADGDYRINFVPSDAAGNTGTGKSRPIRVIRFLSSVKTSVKVFYPQDGDRFASTTSLAFTASKPVTATWTIRDAAGVIVATRLTDAAVAAGVQTWVWNGRRNDGTALPVGIYTSYVTATDGTRTVSQSVKVEMNAFSVA